MVEINLKSLEWINYDRIKELAENLPEGSRDFFLTNAVQVMDLYQGNDAIDYLVNPGEEVERLAELLGIRGAKINVYHDEYLLQPYHNFFEAEGGPRLIGSKQLYSASVFDRELCEPVFELTKSYHEYMPSGSGVEDHLAFSIMSFFTPVFLSTDDVEILATLLENLKLYLSPYVKEDALKEHFDPAISFVSEQQERGRDIVIDCLSTGRRSPVGYYDYFLPEVEIDMDRIRTFFQRIGLELSDVKSTESEGSDKNLFGHKIFYSKTLERESDIVIVVADVHYSSYVRKDWLRLLEYFSSSDTFELVIGVEDSDESSRTFVQDSANFIEIASELKERGHSLLQIYQEMLKMITQANIDEFTESCRRMAPGMSANVCVELYLKGSVTSLAEVGYFGNNTFLPLEDKDLRRTFFAMSDLRGSLKSEESLQKVDFLEAKLSYLRSMAMAKSIKDRLVTEDNKRRVLISRVGAMHVREIVAEILKEDDLSVIGLVSPWVFRSL